MEGADLGRASGSHRSRRSSARRRTAKTPTQASASRLSHGHCRRIQTRAGSAGCGASRCAEDGEPFVQNEVTIGTSELVGIYRYGTRCCGSRFLAATAPRRARHDLPICSAVDRPLSCHPTQVGNRIRSDSLESVMPRRHCSRWLGDSPPRRSRQPRHAKRDYGSSAAGARGRETSDTPSARGSCRAEPAGAHSGARVSRDRRRQEHALHANRRELSRPI